MKFLLGIDIGTSGTKTVLFDTAGKPVASKTVEYPMYQPNNGWAEQDPMDWWDATVDGVKAVLSQSGADASEIAGIGLSGQMHGLVMLDKNGTVLRPSIIWCDQRTGAECDQINRVLGEKRVKEITIRDKEFEKTRSRVNLSCLHGLATSSAKFRRRARF